MDEVETRLRSPVVSEDPAEDNTMVYPEIPRGDPGGKGVPGCADHVARRDGDVGLIGPREGSRCSRSMPIVSFSTTAGGYALDVGGGRHRRGAYRGQLL